MIRTFGLGRRWRLAAAMLVSAAELTYCAPVSFRAAAREAVSPEPTSPRNNGLYDSKFGKRWTACWRQKSLYEGSSMVRPRRAVVPGRVDDRFPSTIDCRAQARGV